MHPHSTNHNVAVVVNTTDLNRETGNNLPSDDTLVQTVEGPSQADIRAMLTNGELDEKLQMHAGFIMGAIAAAAEDGITVTVQQVADPLKQVLVKGLTAKLSVPALGMGFGMTHIELRPARDVVSENYEMIGERKAASQDVKPSV